MVRRSWFTRIRPDCAAIRSTSESCSPSRPASDAVRKSISLDTRRKPRRMRPSKSASAWNLARITRPLQPRNQLRVAPFRLLVLRLGCAVAFYEVGVDFILVREVKRQSSMHLFQGQGRITVDHALRRHSLSEKIDQGIK